MEIHVFDESVDEKFIRELIEPHKDKLMELMDLVKKFDEELSNVPANAYIEVGVLLQSKRVKPYTINYYAIIYPDALEVVQEDYTDWDIEEGITRRVKLAEVYF